MENWRKSSRSVDGNCVEVSPGAVIRIRDSKNPDGPVLRFPPGDWAAFLEEIRSAAAGT